MAKRTLTETVVYNTSYWTMALGFTLGWSLRVSGRANVPASGPVLLVSNHLSHFDPPLIAISCLRTLNFLARSTLFSSSGFSWLIRTLGAVPIDREVGTEGLKSVWNLLDAGRGVLMFPEGTRTEDGLLQPLKPGIALLVKRASCPIVPVGLAGCYEAWPRRQTLPIPAPLLLPPTKGTLGVHFGEPIPGEFYKSMKREAILEDLSARISASTRLAERTRRK